MREISLNDDQVLAESILGIICLGCGASDASVRISVDAGGTDHMILESSFEMEDNAAPKRPRLSPNYEIQFPRSIPLCHDIGISPATLSASPSPDLACPGGWLLDMPGRDVPWKMLMIRAGEWLFSGVFEGIRIELRLKFSRHGGWNLARNLETAGLFARLIAPLALDLNVPSGGDPPDGYRSGNLSADCGDQWGGRFLYGVSRHIRSIRELISRIARSDIPVLVEGENGTGKEIACRGIHTLGHRSARSLVIVNCMEMPGSLLQSELFGHVKGSFTGAHADKKGLIESAAGGTFFLDEIGEMPMHLQASLLRVLQEKEIRKIGESARRRVDVRFVFATNRDLEELVNRGKFRRDLYYRIKGVSLKMLPLRERREDILCLASHFLSTVSSRTKRRRMKITSGAARALMTYRWPGNVRELKNEMERVCALYPGRASVSAGMLSDAVVQRRDGPAGHLYEGKSLSRAVEALEKSMISKALDKCSGNKTHAARQLGITRQGLLKKLKRYARQTGPPKQEGAGSS